MAHTVDREQLSLQQRALRIDTEAFCDDVENAIGDIVCDGLDELEGFLVEEPMVMDVQDPEQIREVRGQTCRRCDARCLCSQAAAARRKSRAMLLLAVAERGSSGDWAVPEASGRELQSV